MTLPAGRVTFLFSDVEGSTKLARTLSADDWSVLLRAHDRLVDAAIAAHGGATVKHEGDGTFAVFPDASNALDAAAGIAADLAAATWPAAATVRLRIGVHTGDGRLIDDGTDYLGVDVHYAARLAAAGNGGQILISDATRKALARDMPAGSSLASAGRRPLKDFDEPRPIYRLVVPGAADDPRPLRGAGGEALPQALTSFVGRATEIGAVSDLVRRSRVVTLTGPGGAGKTRLALSVAEAVRGDFAEGAAFVALAPLRDPGLVAGAIAAAVGVGESPGRPILDALKPYLAERPTLLVLDNVEQLLPPAADLVADLIQAAPPLHVLASSREPMRISGEQEYQVPPLATADAQALFLDRARLIRPDLTMTAADEAAVAQITERLAGLPLAIELAAARTRMFTPREILDRLGRSLDLLTSSTRDLPERQRTLRATIAWSYDLLTPDEQALFRCLAVLAGEWTASTGEAIATSDVLPRWAILDGLASLVDKSLLRTIPATTADEPTAFGRHAFVREFAVDLVERSGEWPELQRRHADVFRAMAAEVGPHLIGADARRALPTIDRAIHDLRQAMTWSLEVGQPLIGLEILGATWRWFQVRSQLREGRDWARRLLDHPAALGDTVARLEALSAAGGLAYWSQDYVATRAYYTERLALADSLGDPRQLAEAHYDLSFIGVVEQDVPLLRHEATLAVKAFEALGDEPGVARARQALVVGHFLAGDYAAATELEMQNLAAFRSTQAWYRVADSLMLMAAIHRLGGETDKALASAREAIRTLPERVGGSTLGAIGVVAVVEAESGDVELAARLTGAIRAIQAETGEALAPVTVLHMPDPEGIVRAKLGPAADLLIDFGRTLTLEEAVKLALGSSETAVV